MKNLMKLSLLLSLPLLWWACSEDDNQLVADVAATAAVVEADNTVVDLVAMQDLGSNPALTVSWAPADYGVQTEVNYQIHMANNPEFNDFVLSQTVTGSVNAYTFTVDALNAEAQKAGLAVEQESPLYIRVGSYLGTDTSRLEPSNTIVVNVKPYFAYIFKDYFLVGAATEPGWDNNNQNPPLFRSQDNPNEYIYTGLFKQDAFKILEFLGQWQPQWGTNDGSTLSGNPATQGNDPDVFSAPAEGYYVGTFNFSSLTFTMTEYAGEATATDYTSVALSGTATGGTDLLLTQSAFDSHIWSAQGVTLSTGTAQFVTNDGSVFGHDNEFNGIATVGGSQIPVTERVYNVWFNDLDGRYMLIPQN